jgi:hypothetical protein
MGCVAIGGSFAPAIGTRLRPLLARPFPSARLIPRPGPKETWDAGTPGSPGFPFKNAVADRVHFSLTEGLGRAARQGFVDPLLIALGIQRSVDLKSSLDPGQNLLVETAEIGVGLPFQLPARASISGFRLPDSKRSDDRNGSNALQVKNLRYSRLKTRATPSGSRP